MSDSWGFETRQIHAGAEADPTTGARATPIYQTTSYVFRDSAHAANLFALAEVGNVYTRIMNPTQGVLEGRINSLEGGVTTAIGLPGTLVVGSGQAAETLAILNLAETGSHVVSSPSLYGGTYNLFHYTSSSGSRRSGPTRRRSTARPSATRRTTCSTSRACRRSPTTMASR